MRQSTFLLLLAGMAVLALLVPVLDYNVHGANTWLSYAGALPFTLLCIYQVVSAVWGAGKSKQLPGHRNPPPPPTQEGTTNNQQFLSFALPVLLLVQVSFSPWWLVAAAVAALWVWALSRPSGGGYLSGFVPGMAMLLAAVVTVVLALGIGIHWLLS